MVLLLGGAEVRDEQTLRSWGSNTHAMPWRARALVTGEKRHNGE
jgi:hypothetical protein